MSSSSHAGQQSPETVKRFPLEWPLGWPRCRSRRYGTFRTDKARINVEQAARRLEDQLMKMGGVDPVLSTNVKLNMRGFPYGNEQPGDPGVAVYFRFKKRPTVLACDTYVTVAANIAAIAAHVDALRRIERYGVGTIEQALAGYKALPADSAADWREIFSVAASWGLPEQRKQVENVYKIHARNWHPDVTHDDGAKMAWLNRARDYAVAELEGRG